MRVPHAENRIGAVQGDHEVLDGARQGRRVLGEVLQRGPRVGRQGDEVRAVVGQETGEHLGGGADALQSVRDVGASLDDRVAGGPQGVEGVDEIRQRLGVRLGEGREVLQPGLQGGHLLGDALEDPADLHQARPDLVASAGQRLVERAEGAGELLRGHGLEHGQQPVEDPAELDRVTPRVLLDGVARFERARRRVGEAEVHVALAEQRLGQEPAADVGRELAHEVRIELHVHAHLVAVGLDPGDPSDEDSAGFDVRVHGQ